MAVTILTYALLSLEEAQARLGISGNEDLLKSMINSLTVYAENVIGRHIIKRTEAEVQTFDINEYERAIFLKNYPIVSIASVVENDETLNLTDDYLKYNDEGKLIRVDNFWYRGYSKVVVTYIGGWAECPWDIKEWAYQCIEMLYNSKGLQNKKSERVGDLAVTYGAGAISALGKDNVLKSYRSNAY